MLFVDDTSTLASFIQGASAVEDSCAIFSIYHILLARLGVATGLSLSSPQATVATANVFAAPGHRNYEYEQPMQDVDLGDNFYHSKKNKPSCKLAATTTTTSSRPTTTRKVFSAGKSRNGSGPAQISVSSSSACRRGTRCIRSRLRILVSASDPDLS